MDFGYTFMHREALNGSGGEIFFGRVGRMLFKGVDLMGETVDFRRGTNAFFDCFVGGRDFNSSESR